MDLAELDYALDPELIATRPTQQRDACRLLICSRSDPDFVEHRTFAEITQLLRRDDLLILNRSAVVPARLTARRADSSGAVDGLYLAEHAPGTWRVLLKSNGKLRTGLSLRLIDAQGQPTDFTLELLNRDGDAWLAHLHTLDRQTRLDAPSVLALVGATPLPPYILKARKDRPDNDADAITDAADRDWYQTVYADSSAAGSVAAPTAGLHFTRELLDTLALQGVNTAEVVLHVGAGTFKPVQADRVEDHDMHEEHFLVPAATRRAIAAARHAGGRTVAVGTTSVRAIESIPPVDDTAREDEDYAGSTDLFIRPGFAFAHTDALITNFHLPRSTLLTLVGALFPQGVPRLLELYAQAIERRYRFYSYGDAMLILP